MIKKTITFTDFDGNEITEDWYFGLSPAEIAELELNSNGTLSERLERVGQSLEEKEGEDPEKRNERVIRASGGEIIQLFRELLMMSVGKRSEDGRRFLKSQDLTDDFVQTGSYSNLLMDLVSNPGTAAEFINGIMPTEAIEKLKQGQPVTDLPLPEKPQWYTEGRVPTDAEIKATNDPELLKEAFRRKSAQI